MHAPVKGETAMDFLLQDSTFLLLSFSPDSWKAKSGPLKCHKAKPMRLCPLNPLPDFQSLSGAFFDLQMSALAGGRGGAEGGRGCSPLDSQRERRPPSRPR